jgi:hypothetical protein
MPVIRRLVAKTLAVLPVIGCFVVLVTIATGPMGTVVTTAGLLAYLYAWDRVQAPGGDWVGRLARLAVPILVAGTVILVAVYAAVVVSVGDPTLALVLTLLGMAAAVGAAALCLGAARRP